VLCMISRGEAHLPGAGDDLVRRAGFAARLGVHLIQIREPHLEAGALAGLVRSCLRAVAGTRTRVVVNDRLDVALVTGAHGVHLREASPAGPVVRTACPPGFLVGRSVHSAADTVRVTAAGGLDYLIFGTVFATSSKPGLAGTGVDGLEAATRATALPVLAIGGVDGDRVTAVARAGAAGFAAIRFWMAPEPDLNRAVGTAIVAFEDSRR
jgi:thiamine-phosphate diphosphorylase